ncbi:uncharacterized protein LOC133352477 [Lethenteron reissneri]|uniref:uncharacterized protein LOC133352477 n=1 Tax=Lethenteron reissneri TaxID=7753 RepID=UPI002AB5E1FA|nr:uncharacterized protein LOC133352477 [Lethenteron reissneri]
MQEVPAAEVGGGRDGLMVLGQAAYPRMDQTALDSLAMEKMLVLAQEMGVVLWVAGFDGKAGFDGEGRPRDSLEAGGDGRRRFLSRRHPPSPASCVDNQERCPTNDGIVEIHPSADDPSTAPADAFLHGYVMDKGALEQLLTDQGRNFSSKLLHEVCDVLVSKPLMSGESQESASCDGPVSGARSSPSKEARDEPAPSRLLCIEAQKSAMGKGPASRTWSKCFKMR